MALPERDLKSSSLSEFAGMSEFEMRDQNEVDGDTERRGLLSGEASGGEREGSRKTFHEESEDARFWSMTRMTWVASALILLLLGASLSRPLLRSACTNSRSSHPNAKFVGGEVRSNGTTDFKRTVLIVSIDGLRADYLDRGLTPHLLDISKQGLRAKFMRPIFPTLTFPNHWALMTGLYAESHGIVANNFWDPQTKSEFHYNKESSTWNPSWWSGEPMWETTGRAGIISANLMWPGPPRTSSGASPTYFVPWKNKVPLKEKLDQIVQWIDLPIDKRPQLITAYEPSLDQAGHKMGPNSKLVNDTLKYVDTFAKDLHSELVLRNLTDIVDVVFVSDHGMTDTSHPELVYLDEILGEDGYTSIDHEDGWPSAGIRFSPACNASHYLGILRAAADANPDKFQVYTRETMPTRYHFAHNDRIAPIYVVPKIGYALTSKAEGDVGMSKGNHGYDNNEPSMFATFVAHGPFSTNVKDVHTKRDAMGATDGWHTIDDEAAVLNGFDNVQVYGLVMKLLGIEEWSAKNNATKGFWDKYF